MTKDEAIDYLCRLRSELNYLISEYDKSGNYRFRKEYQEALWIAYKTLQEQKEGKWLGCELGKCSVCGHEGCASDIWDGCEQMYCPNCGARMVE